MTGAAERPILFLDVGGPLIPFGSSSSSARAPASGPQGAVDQGNPLLGRLDPDLGQRLTALGCDLVWASTWMEEANGAVAPRIGLSRLPVVAWPDACADGSPRGLHWKTRHLGEGHVRGVLRVSDFHERERIKVMVREPMEVLSCGEALSRE
ncbi:hypothetical protein [Streptomyces spiralis]|uniref:hypothetical protein n=1 Tax=Streptomyces spiralis TaxID=66376 RepID=UPI00367E9EF5